MLWQLDARQRPKAAKCHGIASRIATCYSIPCLAATLGFSDELFQLFHAFKNSDSSHSSLPCFTFCSILLYSKYLRRLRSDWVIWLRSQRSSHLGKCMSPRWQHLETKPDSKWHTGLGCVLCKGSSLGLTSKCAFCPLSLTKLIICPL